ncbi:formate dehydrogenase accessory protein FdhE [Burkholderia sp. OK233]|nr:formate dehydrogenase accessory protein FdhE [Burkholderia sp. OK233]
MVQRILEPGQIESLDHTAIPRIRLPERAALLATRAARMRMLADSNPIGGYLRLMASLADAQQQVLANFEAQKPSAEAIARAQQHSMPPVPALSSGRDPAWHGVLHRLLDRVEAASAVTPTLGKVLDGMRANSAEAFDTQADAILAQRYTEIDPVTAPFIMAALQLVWTDLASRLDPRDMPEILDAQGRRFDEARLAASMRTDRNVNGNGLRNVVRMLSAAYCTCCPSGLIACAVANGT